MGGDHEEISLRYVFDGRSGRPVLYDADGGTTSTSPHRRHLGRVRCRRTRDNLGERDFQRTLHWRQRKPLVLDKSAERVVGVPLDGKISSGHLSFQKEQQRADRIVGSFFYPSIVLGCTIRKHSILSL